MFVFVVFRRYKLEKKKQSDFSAFVRNSVTMSYFYYSLNTVTILENGILTSLFVFAESAVLYPLQKIYNYILSLCIRLMML